MLCRDYLYLKMIRQIAPVRNWKHSQTYLGTRGQPQRVEPASSKEVADDDATFAIGCEHFYPINTAFGANRCGLWVEIAGKQEPSWLRTIATQYYVEIKIGQRWFAEAHFAES